MLHRDPSSWFICAGNHIYVLLSFHTSLFFLNEGPPGARVLLSDKTWCRITQSHWKCLCHFKSLPCLSRWHHCLKTHYITPSQALSLKDSTTLCLLSCTHVCTHIHTQTWLSVYKCDINISMHNITVIRFYAWVGEFILFRRDCIKDSIHGYGQFHKCTKKLQVGN